MRLHVLRPGGERGGNGGGTRAGSGHAPTITVVDRPIELGDPSA